MANPFESRGRGLPLNERPADGPGAAPPAGSRESLLGLTRKRPKAAVTLYLDKGLMDQVRRICDQREITISGFVEACVRHGLEQLEKK